MNLQESTSREAGSCSWVLRKLVRDAREGAWVLGASISLSALFYMIDFVSNIITLRTYYFIETGCSNSSSGECSTIRREFRITTFDSIFVVGLSLMIGAHLSNSLIFWMTLPPEDHPLRLAYFLPLIHLSRLLKVLWRTCSFKGLKEYNLEESSSLYSVLSASLETVPQLMLQFHVAMELGLGLKDPDNEWSDWEPNIGTPQPVPKALIISLVASVVSGIYNGSMAVLFLVQKQGMSFPWKAFIPIIAGVHTLAAMTAKTMIVAALAGPVDSQHNCIGRSKYKWINWLSHALHSLAIAHVSLFIGPMYVIVKYFDEPSVFLIWSTLLHIFVELSGVIDVIVVGRLQNGWEIWDPPPCNAMPQHVWQERLPYVSVNTYLTCSVFLGVLWPSLLVLFLSALLFVVVNNRVRCELPRQDVGKHQGAAAVTEIISQDQELQLLALEQIPTCTRKLSSCKLYIYTLVVLFIKKLTHKRGRMRQRPCLDEAEIQLLLEVDPNSERSCSDATELQVVGSQK
ncbi:hypothetical protein GOP47_0027774 [Adiantum capillus-veneris]|nr:hypothetical protein GOP47_0027774 [Adiantum capillus-veneris]